MTDFSKIQQNSINEWRQLHQDSGAMVMSDEAVASAILTEFFVTGKIYPGFESIVGQAPIEKSGSVFTNSLIQNNTSEWQDVNSNRKANLSPTQQRALDFLCQMTSDASRNMEAQERRDGWDNDIANFFKECFNTEYAKSNVKKAISSTQKDINALENTALNANSTQISFEEIFYKQRGVEFDIKLINLCDEKAKAMADVQSVKDCINNIKKKLKKSLVNNIGNAIETRDYGNGKIARTQGEFAILDTLQFLGIKKQEDINRMLSEIEENNVNSDAFTKYGKDIRLEKDDKGNWVINVTNASGERSPMLQEHAQLIGKELERKLTLVYAENIGAEYREDMTTEELDEITTDLYNKYKSEYEESFQKAYGKKDLKALSQNYIMSQQQLATWVNVASFATMFIGSGLPLKGIQYLNTAAQGTRLAATTAKAVTIAADVTSKAEKLMPLLMVNQVLQPVQLLHNLTSDEPDWKAYGMSVAEGSMWMLLGMASGVVGDKARVFLKEKGLSFIAKNSGMSIDDLMNIYRSGQEIPANLTRAFKMIETVALASGSSVEFVADVMLTGVVNKAVYGTDITTMEKLMSLNGVLLGAAMQRKNMAKSNEMKLGMFELELKKYCPDLSPAEITSRAKMLVELSAIAEDKMKAKPRIFEGDSQTPVETGVYRLEPEQVKFLNGEAPEVTPKSNVETVFDDKNRLSLEITKDSDGNVVSQTRYLYGSDGKLTAKDVEFGPMTERTVYSPDGRVYSEINYVDGKESTVAKYSYIDDESYTISRKKVGVAEPFAEEIYKDGKISKKIEKEILDVDNGSKRIITTVYDETGDATRTIKYSDKPNEVVIETIQDGQVVATDKQVDYIKETARQETIRFGEAVNNFRENNYEQVRIFKDFTPEERQWFIENPLKRVSDNDTFVLFANGDKPSALLPIEMPQSIIDKLKQQGVDVVNRDMWGDVTNSFLLNPTEVKSVIDSNYEIYSTRMGMQGASVDEIYSKLLSEDSPLKYEEDFPDLVGLTLGFPPANTLIYTLENQLKDFKLSDRFNDDISGYKEMLKEALYAQDSPYAQINDELKSAIAEIIDSMEKVTRSGEALYGDEISRSPYQFINYVDEPNELGRIRNSLIDVVAKERKGEPLTLTKPTKADKLFVEDINHYRQQKVSPVDIMDARAQLSPVEMEYFKRTLSLSNGGGVRDFSIEQAYRAAKLSPDEFECFDAIARERIWRSKDWSFDYCYEFSKLSLEDQSRIRDLQKTYRDATDINLLKKALEYKNDDLIREFIHAEIPMRLDYEGKLNFVCELIDKGVDLEFAKDYLAQASNFLRGWLWKDSTPENRAMLVDYLSRLNKSNSSIQQQILNEVAYKKSPVSLEEMRDWLTCLENPDNLDLFEAIIYSDDYKDHRYRYNGDYFDGILKGLEKDSELTRILYSMNCLEPKTLDLISNSKKLRELILSIKDSFKIEAGYTKAESLEQFLAFLEVVNKYEKDLPFDEVKNFIGKAFSDSTISYERRNLITVLKKCSLEDFKLILSKDLDYKFKQCLSAIAADVENRLTLTEMLGIFERYDIHYTPNVVGVRYLKEMEKINASQGREVFSKKYLENVVHKMFSPSDLEGKMASNTELLLKHDNLCMTTKTLDIINDYGAEKCLDILNRSYETTIPATTADMYGQVFAKFSDRAEQFGCKTFSELEAYLKTAKTDRASAGKLMGEIKKAALDEFLSIVPIELQAFVIGQSGTFTAKDLEIVLDKIGKNPDLAKIMEFAKQEGDLPVSAKLYAAAILADNPIKYGVWEIYYNRSILGADKRNLYGKTLDDVSKAMSKKTGAIDAEDIVDKSSMSPQVKAGFTQFNKKFDYANSCFNILSEKVEKFAEAHGQRQEFEETFKTYSSDLFAGYLQMNDCADIIGEGHLKMLLHDESAMRVLESIANISIMRSKGTFTAWEAIFAGTKLKDNEVKQLISLSRSLDPELLAKLLHNCAEEVELPSGKAGLNLDVQKMFSEMFNLIAENVGEEYKNRPEILEGWDMNYFSYILGAQRNLGKEDAELLKGLLKATFDGNYKEFLFDETSPNGALNLKTKVAYEDAGLDFKQWLEFDGVKEVTLKADKNKLKTTLDNVVKGLESDLSVIFANDKLKTIMQPILAEQGFAFENGHLRQNGVTQFNKDSLKKLTESLIKFTKDNGKILQNIGALDIRDHCSARLRVITQASNVSVDENFTISLWKRDAKHDLFQGHYCQCCISLDGINKKAIVHSLTHTVDNIVELKNSSGDTVGKAKVLWMKDNNTGEPVMLVNGFEITGSAMYNEHIRDAFTEYFKDYSKAVAGKEVPIYTGICTYQKIPMDDLTSYSTNISMLGSYPDNTYHLDAFHVTDTGSWPRDLDKPKDLTVKVLYKPE